MNNKFKHLRHFKFPDSLEGFNRTNEMGLQIRSRPPRFDIHKVCHTAGDKTDDEDETIEQLVRIDENKNNADFKINKIGEEKPVLLNIPYKKELPFKQKDKSFLKFILFSAIIFSIVFFSMNYHSYYQILAFVSDPYTQKIKEEKLEKIIGQEKKRQKLLPEIPKNRLAKKTLPAISFPIAPPDNRIIIPKIGKNAPIIEMKSSQVRAENWASFEGAIQKSLKKGVVHYPGTAYPGQYGNVFITGHSSYYPWDTGKFKDIFALLPKMQVGDKFYIYYKQKKYIYQIIEKKEVKPTAVGVLDQPKNKKIATLMTCVPVGTTLRRLILHAKEV